MAEHRCLTCSVYRPDAEPRIPRLLPVCDGDRSLLEHQLGEIPDLHHRVLHPEPLEVDDRTYILPDPDQLEYAADPLAVLGGAGPVGGRSRQPRVSGSRGVPAPTPLEPIDLTLPARAGTRRLLARAALGLDEDQVGSLSVATILETWVRDWRGTLWPDQSLPQPTVYQLSVWLRNRLEDACNQHPAIDEFAAEIREVRSALRGVLGEVDAQPETEPYEGIACRRCDLRAVLLRRPGDHYIECGGCGLLYTDDELEAWTRHLAGYERSIRSVDEVAALLRRPGRHAA